MSDAWAVLPVKDLAHAKQRLESVLSPRERAALYRAMLEDVLQALAGARRLAGVLVVTRDAEVKSLAGSYRAEVLAERENLGQTSAVLAGARRLAERGITTAISIPGDVPLVTAAEIDAVLGAQGSAPAITIAPAHDRLGSNAVACSPPDVMPLRFGDNSFYPHLERARSLGIEPAVVDLPGLSLDIDHPHDLRELLEREGPTRAHQYLDELDIRQRLDGLAFD